MKMDEKNFLDPEVRRYELSFRDPRLVEYMPVNSGDGRAVYPVCPRCHLPLRRPNQAFCTECGQKLDWGSVNNIQS